MLDSLRQDVRYGTRALARSRAFTTVALLSLGVGIGLSTTIFSVTDGILFRPLPLADPDQLVRITAQNPRAGAMQLPLSALEFDNLRAQATAFAAIGGYAEIGVNLSGPGDAADAAAAERGSAAAVTPGLFSLLGVHPTLGREFARADAEPAAPPALVIGDELWRRRFGGAPAVIGRVLRLDGVAHTIVGVMPPGFAFPEIAGLWIASASAASDPARDERLLEAVARLRPGATLDRARAELTTIARRLEQAYPTTHAGVALSAQPYAAGRAEGAGPVLLALLGAVVFVLLIACANLGNLLLARMATRRRELTVRAAVGASRARLLRQLLTESALLALGGALLGVVLALAGVRVVWAMLPSEEIVPYWIHRGVDARVLAFAGAVTLLSVFAFGLAPAVEASGTDLGEALKEGRRTGVGRRAHRLRSALVSGEVALAVVLLVGAGLMLRSFLELQATPSGYDRPDRVLTLRTTLSPARYDSPERAQAYWATALDQLGALPGVEAAGAYSWLRAIEPSPQQPGLELDGGGPLEREQANGIRYLYVTPGFGRATGLRLRRGRGFEPGERAAPVALISSALAQRLWPDTEPLGRRVRITEDGVWRTIVGVVEDTHRPVLRGAGLQTEALPTFYLPTGGRASWSMTFALRTRGDPRALAFAARRELLALDPDQPVTDVRTLEREVARGAVPFRWLGSLFALFGALALVLAALGVYGVMAYTIGQRTHEIGVRIALGARAETVLGLVLRQALWLVLAGAALGLAGALAVSRVLRSLLYQVHPADPLTFAAVALVLGATALAASVLPARRAARVDPMAALRVE